MGVIRGERERGEGEQWLVGCVGRLFPCCAAGRSRGGQRGSEMEEMCGTRQRVGYVWEGKGAVEEGWRESAEGSGRVCESSADLVLFLPQRVREVGQGAGEGDVAVRATYPGLGGGGEARRGAGKRRRRERKSSRLQCLTSFSLFAFCVRTR